LLKLTQQWDNWEESLNGWKKCVESGQTASQNYFNLGLAYLKNGYKKEAEDISMK